MSVVSDNAPHKCPVCGLVREWCACPSLPEAVAKNATARAPEDFIHAAARAYHRAERDSFAEMGESLGLCAASEWPGASTLAGKRQSKTLCRKMWAWAMARWGLVWTKVEYAVRIEDEEFAEIKRQMG